VGGLSSEASSARPNFYVRAVVSLVLLAGFYAVTVSVSAGLFVVPLFVLKHGRIGTYLLFVFGACWIPASLLILGIVNARPPPFRPGGPRLERHQAPELFALLDKLAGRAGTAAPTEIYLSPLPDLSVTESGGFLGFGAKRILQIGVPLLGDVTVAELRAGLAHELGHFVGGDTRLTGILSYTVSLFHSVLESVKRDAFREGTSHNAIEAGFAMAKIVGDIVVRGYARLYFFVMSASSRRQELAADALAAEIAGRDAVIRLLEKVSVLSPSYRVYLQGDVGFAVREGAMPTDLLEGYQRFRARFDMLPIGVELLRAARERKDDPYDSHPPPSVRIAKLRAMIRGVDEPSERSALSLLVDANLLGGWFHDVTLNMMQPKVVTRSLPWANIPSSVYAPNVTKRAREVAAALHAVYPDCSTLAAMFLRVVDVAGAGRAAEVMGSIAAGSAHLPPALQAQVTPSLGAVLALLFQGALLERGGVIEDSLGAPCLVVRFGGDAIPAARIAIDSVNNEGARALLLSWADRLRGAAH
jgi:Zn-dependent protease with chaperone function